MSRLLDISQPVTEQTPPWPGDEPYRLRWTVRRGSEQGANVSAVSCSPHIGTHVDAPLHFQNDGLGVGDLPLAPFVGPCRVIDTPRGRHLTAEDLRLLGSEPEPRLLLRTHECPAPPKDFVALEASAATWLVENGVRLVGIDTPSIDPPDSGSYEAHRILSAAGVALLENLLLHHVRPGSYELLALPLRWPQAEASPVRAVLREL